ncbi:hypothetical protein THRCLA_03304 [Thraustotheca clavata]|uniref:Uncharacterized protein n=1 Tax=Thraustotheca clavata TaxID=74557 RepID=A0A1W0A2F7_9STRA|nr:hypothetical protein THRCLA_03304 [Thraustotheca clavata]
MAIIQKLHRAVVHAVRSVRGRALTIEEIEPIKELCESILPVHVGLEVPTAATAKDAFKGSKAIRYIHIYEDAQVSIGIFVLPPGASIPLHNHPEMSVISRVLYGSLHVRAFDLVPTEANDAFWAQHDQEQDPPSIWKRKRSLHLAQERFNAVVTAPHTTELLPHRGNLHEFTSDPDIGCAILDVLTPPYNPSHGRDCTYYRIAAALESDEDDMPIFALEASSLPPKSFDIVNLCYRGPPVFAESLSGSKVVKDDLIFFTIVHVFTFLAFSRHFFVVLFKGSKIFTGFREFTFFHTFTNIPVDKSTLGIHQIKLVVNTREHFSNSTGVGDHAASTLDTSKITAWNHGWRFVVDTTLETSRAPVHKLNGTLGLDGGNSSIDILRDDITTVHQTSSHVFTMAWITLSHHRKRIEAAICDFSHRELFMVSLFSTNHRSVRAQHEMDTWVWHQVGLEFGDINVEGAIETQRSGQRRNDLSNQTIEVGVRWTFNVERTLADIIDCFVIQKNRDISVFQEGVGSQDGVVWFNNSSGDLWGWVDGETKLGFTAIVDRQAFKQEGTQTRTSTTTNSIEHHETLETSAAISKLAYTVQNGIDNFLTNGVVTTSIVVSSIFLARNNLFRMIQLTVHASTDFITHGWFQIGKDSTRNVFTSTSFAEECVKGIITTTDGLVRWHLTIRLNTMFKAIQFPAGITYLNTALAKMNRKDLAHCNEVNELDEAKLKMNGEYLISSGNGKSTQSKCTKIGNNEF